MYKFSLKNAFFIFSLIAASAAHASPLTYNFSATNFEALFGFDPVPPVNSVSGSFTLDNNNLVALDLTIGSRVYSISEVEYSSSGNLFSLGGKLKGINVINVLTNDFLLSGDLRPENMSNMSFKYSVPTAFDVYDSIQGYVVAAPSCVPLPSAALLFGSGFFGLIGLARKRG